MKSPLKRAIWVVAYGLVLIAPVLIMVLAPRPAARQFWRDAAVAIGYVGFALMGVQLIPTGRLPFLTDLFALDAIYKVHHRLSRIAFFMVLAHPVLLIVQNPYNLVALNLLSAPWKLRAGPIALISLVLLIATSVWRQWLRLKYEVWRVLHNVFTAGVIGASMYHIHTVGYFTALPLQRALWIAYGVVWAGITLYVRAAKPLMLLRKPYRVSEVIAERGNTWSLVLEPDGHPGHDFRSGQVAWLSTGRTPFTFAENPFSYASSEHHPGRISFAIRELGDWTGKVGALEKGARVFVDGPYGTFDMEDHPGEGYVFIAGGIGAAPVMSMLRTLDDCGDRQPLTFFYGNPTWESITFREELEAMKERLNLKLVHVLERPPEGWEGETGYITKDVLGRHVPFDLPNSVYFICGPLPMIRGVTRALHALKVPRAHCHAEQYEMA
ncbi:MAG: ferric reductase-like transmembrane domain-containing protein [Anaerolineae bacterium]|nr:ferric reductase-like transmembrane domain-containing protein [Anaerolineae bacterium]